MLVTELDFADVAAWLDRQDEIAIDTETTGLDPYARKHRVCGVSIGGHDGAMFYLPFRHSRGYNLPLLRLRQLNDYLAERTANGSLKLIFWHAKFDLHMLAADGFEPPVTGCIEDAMLGAHLLNENEPTFGLKEFCDRHKFGPGSLDEKQLRELIEAEFGRSNDKEWKAFIHKMPADVVAPYAETDVVLTMAASDNIRPALAAWKLDRLYADVNDYMLLIWRMERRGIRLDRAKIDAHMRSIGPTMLARFDDLLAVVKEKTGDVLDPIVKDIHRPRVGKRGKPLKVYERKTFNPASIPQLQALTGWPRTDVRYLEELADDDPFKTFADNLLDYRVASKMSGTYYDAYLSLIDEKDDLRPNYNLQGTVSGRASCSKPNLQNVPRYTARRPVKEVFIPHDGYVFVEFDYKQAELRLAAHYADETRMRDIFARGVDPHAETAKNLGIPRFVGKTLNLLIIYGGGERAVTKTLRCSPQEARAYLSGYRSLYPRFERLSKICEAKAERDGYIRLESGRLRHFNTWKRYRYESETRKAMNSLIQGTAAEMLRIAMQRLDARIRAEGLDAHLLLQVHDSLLIEVRPEFVGRLIDMLQEEMTNFGFNPAPAIEIKIGRAWAPMEEVAA